MENQFRSRVSVLLLVLVLAGFTPIVYMFPQEIQNSEFQLALVIVCVSLLPVTGILFSMRYDINENELQVKLGPITYNRINIKDIRRVERSYNPLSSPAASLKRLSVVGNDINVLISPVREKEFIRMLQSRNPAIEVKISDDPAWYRFWDWDV